MKKLKKNFKNINVSKYYSGEGIIINNNNAKGVIIKGIKTKNSSNLNFLKNNVTHGDLNKFEKTTAFIGAELAFNLDLKVGDKINLMSSAFVTTPFGGLPKQELL